MARAPATAASVRPRLVAGSSPGRRRLLDELLVSALDRALPLVQVHDAAVGVGEHLHLDVARPLQVALEIDRRVAERRLRASRGGGERRGQIGGALHARHADPAAAAAALRISGKPMAPAAASAAAASATGPGRARHVGTPGRGHEPPRLRLVAHGADRLGGGPMNVSPARAHASAKRQFSERKP
jgi:hypothetical protein